MMSQKKNAITVILLLLGVSLLFSNLSRQETAKELFEKAVYLEETKGNLEKAIEAYDRIIKEFPDERTIAAKAQLQIGMCFEKLGLEEAEKAFQKVVDNYPDQQEAVKTAREKLSILQQAKAIIQRDAADYKVTKLFESKTDIFGFLSPDCKKLALIKGGGDIWLRDIESGKETRLTEDPVFKYICFWSPDSQHIAYLDSVNSLFVVPANGGEPKTLIKYDSDTAKKYPLRWPTGWTSDSKMLICQVDTGLVAIPISGGDWVDVYKLPEQKTPEDFGMLTLSPNGKFLAFENKSSGNDDIYVMPVEGGQPVQVTSHPRTDTWPHWSFDGRWISFTSSRSGRPELWAVKIAPDGTQEGEPILVYEGLNDHAAYRVWARGGKIGISLGRGVGQIFVRDLETGEETQITNVLSGKSRVRWSPDGSRIAFSSSQGGIKNSLWTIPATGGEPKLATINVPDPAENSWVSRPSWTPDGNTLVFTGFFGFDPENRGVWKVPSEGGELQKMELDFDGGFEGCDVSPDGSNIVFCYSKGEKNPIEGSRESGQDIYVMPMEGGTPQRITKIDQEGLGFRMPRWSPDGKRLVFESLDWVAYAEGKPSERIWLCEFPEGEPNPITEAIEGGIGRFSWSPDGKTIYFSKWGEDNKSQLHAMSVDGGEMTNLNIQVGDISPDGKKIAFSRNVFNIFEYWLIENFLPAEKKD
jgi:Tol biopolymer transport system component